MSFIKNFGLFVLLVVLILLYGSFYTVQEGKEALLLRLGELVINPATGQPYEMQPGLHFKYPFINQVREFDMRLQTLSVQSSRLLTAEQKYVIVDYYVKWRINNLPLYFTRTGGLNRTADTLLQQQANDALRAAFGQRTITEVVSAERSDLMRTLQKNVAQTASKLGIEIVDVRVKAIDLPKEVSDSVFARMSAQREQVAARHRSDGKAKAEKIEAQAEAKTMVIIAEAKEQGARIRAKGIQEAARIYAQAYQKNPEFYAFYRSLEAYKQTFNNKQDMLLLMPDNQFFKYFKNATGTSTEK